MNKYLKYMAAAIFIIALAMNVATTLNDPFVNMGEVAIATGGGDKVKETIVGAGMYITAITGQAAIDAGLSLGMRIANMADLSLEIQGQITAEFKDEFKIICYEGGSTYCTPMDWHACASGGCPTAGLTGDSSSSSTTTSTAP